jgi:hypothetical protein
MKLQENRDIKVLLKPGNSSVFKQIREDVAHHPETRAEKVLRAESFRYQGKQEHQEHQERQTQDRPMHQTQNKHKIRI